MIFDPRHHAPGVPPGESLPRTLRWAVRLAVLALLVSAAATVIAAWRALPPRVGVRPGLEDDAYYYLVIAKHAVRGDGISFDGFRPTNGFHPLWMAVTVAVVRIVGLGSSLRVQAAAYAGACMGPLLIGAAACVCHFASLRAAGDPRALVFLGILLGLALPETGYVCMVGVESGLLVCLLILTVWAYLFERSGWFAVLLPLVFLTRIDAPLWLAPLILHEAMRAVTWRRRAALVMPLAATMAGLGTFNVISTGSILPIHAALTSTFPFPSPKWHLLVGLLTRGVRTFTYANHCSLLIAAALGMFLWVRARRAGRAEGATPIVALIAAATISLALLLFFRKWMKPPGVWHYSEAVVLLSGALALLALREPERHARSIPNLVALTASLLAALVSGKNLAHAMTADAETARHLLRQIDDATPLPGRLASTDCGYLAFWMDRDIVNLDGLTNDRAYQEALRGGKLHEYLDQAGVTYLLTSASVLPFPGEPMYRVIGANPDAVQSTGDYTFSYFVYSYLYETFSDTLTFRRNDEVFRGPFEYGGRGFVFRWPPAQARRD